LICLRGTLANGNRLSKNGAIRKFKRKAPAAAAAHRGFLVQRQSRVWRIVIVW
jgi:hypothetical protein